VQRIFAQIFPNCLKSCRATYADRFYGVQMLHDTTRRFYGDSQKKNGLHLFFCKPWAQFFEVKQGWAPFLPRFSGILFGFSTNQNFWGCACTPCTPASCTTARATTCSSYYGLRPCIQYHFTILLHFATEIKNKQSSKSRMRLRTFRLRMTPPTP